MLTASNDSINLWTMYDYIMNVGDGDSTYTPIICDKCEEDLKAAYVFKLMCSETERMLNGQSEENNKPQSDTESEIEYIYFDIEGNGDADDVHNVEKCEGNSVVDNVELCEVDGVMNSEDSCSQLVDPNTNRIDATKLMKSKRMEAAVKSSNRPQCKK